MPYNPGISFDASPIANGLASAGQNLAQGILERARKREEKQKWASAVETLQPIVAEMSGGKVDLSKDTPKEAIPSLISLAENYQREQRDGPLRALQIENEKLRQRLSQRELDQAATDADALKASARYLAPSRALPNPDAVKAALASGQNIPSPVNQAADAALALQTYIDQGGTDPRVLAQFGDLAGAQMKAGNRPQPGLVNYGQAYGRDVIGLQDAQGNVKVMDNPEDQNAMQTQRGKLIKERDYWKSAGRTDLVAGYDEAIANLDRPNDKPLSLNEFFASPQLSAKFKDDYAAYRQAWSQQQGRVTTDTAPGDQPNRKFTAEEQQAYDWLQANPDHPKAAAVRKALNLD